MFTRLEVSLFGLQEVAGTHTFESFWYSVAGTLPLPGSQPYISSCFLFESLLSTFACASVKWF
jgi:hypothetical protein